MMLLIVFIFLFSGVYLHSENLLLNWSFETVQEEVSRLPESWEAYQRNTLEPHHRLDRTLALDGQTSACLSNEVPALKSAVVMWMQRQLGVPFQKVPVGSEVEFSVYARSEGEGSVCRIYFESLGSGTFISPATKLRPGVWQKVSVRFTKPDKSFASAYACLQLLGNGTVFFDKAYLGLASAAPAGPEFYLSQDENRLLNPSMEMATQEGVPVQWGILSEKDGSGSLDSSRAFNGAKSLMLSCADDIKAPAGLLWMQRNIQERLVDCPPGTEMEFSVHADTAGDPSVHFRFYIEMMKGGKFIGSSISKPESIYQGWDKRSLRFTMPEEVPDSVYVCLQLLTPGKVWFDQVSLAKAKPEEPEINYAVLCANDYCRVSNFPVRQTYFLPELPQQLQLEFYLPASELRIVLQEIHGKEVQVFTLKDLPVREKATAVLKLPVLPAGAYELRYESGEGPELLQENDLFRIREKQTKGVHFTQDHRMLLNGKPFFPIMIMTPAMSRDALRVYQESGFNSICFGGFTGDPDISDYMGKMAAEYNLAVVAWANLGDQHMRSDENIHEWISRNAENAARLPNFIGWLDDESEHRQIPIKSLERTYREIFAAAPDYVFWQNHAPRLTGTPGGKRHGPENVRRFSRQTDVTGLDIYPVPNGQYHNDLPNKSLSCVGEYTDLASASAFHSKPIWMVLQAFGWSEEGGGTLTEQRPRPTKHELRFMIYNAITHGSNGIVLYGGGLKDLYSPYMAMLAELNHELEAVLNVWKTGTDLLSDRASIRARKAGQDSVYIVVNESQEAQDFVFPCLEERLYSLPDGKEIAVQNQQVKLTLEPLEVALLLNRKVSIPAREPFQPRKAAVPASEPYPRGIHYLEQEILLAAEWTVHPKYIQSPGMQSKARQSFFLTDKPASARLRIAGDDYWKVWINGQFLGQGSGHGWISEYEISSVLKAGENLLEGELFNVSGPSGLLFEIKIGEQIFASGAETEFSSIEDKQWVKAHCAGRPPVKPWKAPRWLFVRNQP